MGTQYDREMKAHAYLIKVATKRKEKVMARYHFANGVISAVVPILIATLILLVVANY